MKRWILLLTAFALWMICTTTTASPADSILWDGIRRVAVLVRQQQTDTALLQVKRLLPIAESLNSQPAVASLRAQGAACLLAKRQTEAALAEFQQGIAVCEQGTWLATTVEKGQQQWLDLCISMYVQTATISEKTGNRQKAVETAKRAASWIAMSTNRRVRASATLALGGLLTDGVGKQQAQKLFTQAFYDAKALESKDMILMAATQLLEFDVSKKSNPPLPPQKETDSLPAANPPASAAIHHVEKPVDGKSGDLQPKTVPTIIPIIVLMAGLLLLVFVIYAVVQQHAKRRQMTRSYMEGREEERSRLARELHDGVSNQLLAVQMKLSGGGNTEQVLKLLDESREQVRRVSHGLMPPDFAYTSLTEAVTRYVAELNESSPCDISCNVSPADFDWTAITQQQALAIYRIVQEAVANALKHAHTTTIAVGIHHEDSKLTVTISTDGTVTETQSTGNGIGLRTMQQRAADIGAVLDISHGSYGYTVTLTLPVPVTY